MAYVSWSVVYGEQPSAAKWNILGSNDASFNDGTGFIAGAPTKANTYCFRAWDSGGTTLTDATDVQINLATENYDYNNNFAASAYTAPVNGVYHFDASFNTSTLTGGVRATAFLTKNGAGLIYGTTCAPITTGALNTVSGDVLLAAGDVIKFWGVQDSGANETTVQDDKLTWFAGHLVHAT